MRFQLPESGGAADVPSPKPGKVFKQHSTNLPFGQPTSLSSVGGPSYVTAQTLVQQVAYTLSDSLWTYSPETFDLDTSAKDWSAKQEHNAYGRHTRVQSMEIRQGAASVALGYAFSKDFDTRRRHVPQSMIASTSALQYLQPALDELSLLYSVASPFVAHIAALDYSGSASQLVPDYASAITLAEELGFALVSNFSAHEGQHMSLFATTLAQIIPTIHIYDGVTVGRETVRVIDVLDQAGILKVYENVQKEISARDRKSRYLESAIVRLLRHLNDELGTQYRPFEFVGHNAADTVLVAFGTIESSLASQVAASLAQDGKKVGVVNVRICKPFLEEEFLAAIPNSVRTIGVLGQVSDQNAVRDPALRSSLYNDVFGSTAFSEKWATSPEVVDLKYPRETIWAPISIAAAFQMLVKDPLLASVQTAGNDFPRPLGFVDPSAVQQYTFWDLDTSYAADAATALSQALSIDSASNVTTRTTHDNLAQGGLVRTDIRKSKRTVESSFAIKSADVAYIGDLAVFNEVNVVRNVKTQGSIILRLPNVKDEDIEKKLSAETQKALSSRSIRLYVLDPSASEAIIDDPSLETYLVQSCFLRIALPSLEKTGLEKLAAINGSTDLFDKAVGLLGSTLRQIELPENWSATEVDETSVSLPADIRPSSFAAFEKEKPEPETYLKDWQTAAKGLAFKEAYDARTSLRPDVAQKTHIVHVKENRRLTPLSYDRNIFHIEFDLGDSGLTYDIGEALGIHAENDPDQVLEFIKFYGLDPSEVVEVPSRENASVLENRTVYQTLVQNIDIFGRPPKRFYESLATFASDANEAKELLALGGPEGANEFKRRAEVDTVTYADILLDFPSAHPSFHDIVRIVSPMKRREYSIASCQKVTPKSVALMIVVVNWVDPKGRDRFGQATRFLWRLTPGTAVTVSVKPSVMKLPPKSTQPLIMAGLGTGLAPFRAFVQHRAWEKAQGHEIGPLLLYMGSRHQREEYCYGEEWEAYRDAGVITLLGRAFSRDQPQKIYIQDRMRETLDEIVESYVKDEGAFYLCGPTWPVPDVTNVLEEGIAREGKREGRKVVPRKEIERLKEEGRYVLEVY